MKPITRPAGWGGTDVTNLVRKRSGGGKAICGTDAGRYPAVQTLYQE